MKASGPGVFFLRVGPETGQGFQGSIRCISQRWETCADLLLGFLVCVPRSVEGLNGQRHAPGRRCIVDRWTKGRPHAAVRPDNKTSSDVLAAVSWNEVVLTRRDQSFSSGPTLRCSKMGDAMRGPDPRKIIARGIHARSVVKDMNGTSRIDTASIY